MNTLKGASTFRVFIRGLFKGASTHKTFSVTSQVLAFSKNLLKFVIVSIIYGQDCSLQLGIVKNCSIEKVKCEIWQEYIYVKRKNTPISLLAWDGSKGCIQRGGKCCSSWVLNLYLTVKNVFWERMQFLATQWVVGLVFGWFVQYLAGLCMVWMVCGWFRVLQLTLTVCSNESKFCNRDFW